MATHFRHLCRNADRIGASHSTFVPSKTDCGSCRRIFDGFNSVAWALQRLELQKIAEDYQKQGGNDPDTASRYLRELYAGAAECAHRAQVAQLAAVKRAREALGFAIDEMETVLRDEEEAQGFLQPAKFEIAMKRATRLGA